MTDEERLEALREVLSEMAGWAHWPEGYPMTEPGTHNHDSYLVGLADGLRSAAIKAILALKRCK